MVTIVCCAMFLQKEEDSPHACLALLGVLFSAPTGSDSAPNWVEQRVTGRHIQYAFNSPLHVPNHDSITFITIQSQLHVQRIPGLTRRTNAIVLMKNNRFVYHQQQGGNCH